LPCGDKKRKVGICGKGEGVLDLKEFLGKFDEIHHIIT
jgi:hypothetical protein